MTRSLRDQCAFIAFPGPLPIKILASDVRTLNLDTKSKLLRPAVPFPESYKTTAKNILGYVHALSGDSLDSVFALKSDDIKDVPLRLLNPGGTPPGTEDSFITASYRWMPAGKGAPPEDYTEADSADDGPASYPIPMSRLLYQAFLHERQSAREGVWIDQVCINQTSEAEKRIAVNAMDIIYKSARAVIVLLDDVEVSNKEQDFLASYMVEHAADDFLPHRRERPAYMKRHPVLRNFFTKMISAQWFERAWCSHEMRLGTEHVFLMRCEPDDDVGNGSTAAPTVLRFTGLFMMHLLALAVPADLAMLRLDALIPVFGQAIAQKIYEERTGGKAGSTPGSKPEGRPDGRSFAFLSYMQIFADVFAQFAGGNPALDTTSRAHDANLDKLAIAVNTLGLGLSVKRLLSATAASAESAAAEDSTGKNAGASGALPPATDDEVCRRFTILALCAGDLTALCSTGRELNLDGPPGTPGTWMRWPAPGAWVRSPDLLARGPWAYGGDLDTGPAAAFVGLTMCMYNGAAGTGAGGARWASERKLRICRAFKEGCEAHRIYSVNFRDADG